MKSLSSWLLVMFMGMFSLFRVAVAFQAQYNENFGGFKMALDTGMKMIKTEKVTVENAAKTLGSGSLLVYGTPAMLLLVEKTAVALLDGHLDEGMTTVGTNLNVDHVSASPIGCEVSCEVTLTEIDRKKLTFAVEVKDPAGVIGKGMRDSL